MKEFNSKVQMMDAGMTLFESEENFGNTLGQVKAEMETYGKVLKSSELDTAKLPVSTGECDLFMDWSSIWRIRYISCHVESAGERIENGKTIYKYAASFKEGNRSTSLRGIVMMIFMVIFTIETIFASRIIFTLQGLIFAGLTAYLWILPSRKAQNNVQDLEETLRKGIQ